MPKHGTSRTTLDRATPAMKNKAATTNKNEGLAVRALRIHKVKRALSPGSNVTRQQRPRPVTRNNSPDLKVSVRNFGVSTRRASVAEHISPMVNTQRDARIPLCVLGSDRHLTSTAWRSNSKVQKVAVTVTGRGAFRQGSIHKTVANRANTMEI